MKGLQCKELTGIDALTLTELEDPKPGPDEVVIDVIRKLTGDLN